MAHNVMSLAACDELARLVGHRRFEIETFELVLDARIVNLDGYWAHPARGLIREDDGLLGTGAGSGTCGEWAARHFSHAGSLVGQDLALRPFGDGKMQVRHFVELTITVVVLSWPVVPAIGAGRLELNSAEGVPDWVKRTPDENGRHMW